MKTLEHITEMRDYDTIVELHRNLEDRDDILKELKGEYKHTSVYEDHGEIIFNVIVPPCGHEHDCCGCVCGRRFTIRPYYTEEAISLSL